MKDVAIVISSRGTQNKQIKIDEKKQTKKGEINMATNTMINDTAMENAAGGITASEYWDGVKYLLFGDEYENYIREQKEKEELFGEESHWNYRKQLGL